MPLISGGGAALPVAFQTGAATPYGSVVPAGIGSLYIDTTHGASYIAVGVTNTSWVQLGGNAGNNIAPGVGGYVSGGNENVEVVGVRASSLTDVAAVAGSGNGILWSTSGSDGDQNVQFVLGTNGAFTHEWTDDGNYHVAENLIVVNMPTADPGVSGALYTTAGIVHRSP
jgi:hypothetical protein